MKTLFYLLVFGVLFAGCKTDTPVEQRDEYKEIMKVHDDAMEKIGEINDLTNKLQQQTVNQADSLMAEKSKPVQEMLEKADDGMMNWMQEWKVPEDISKENLDKFFSDQKQKVDKVNNDIDKAIEQAKKFLEDKNN